MGSELREGMRIGGGFVLVRPLGAGGAGEVWLATESALGRDVAVKFCKAHDEASATRFIAEARALASVRHPGIVPILHFGTDETTGRSFFAMPAFPSTLKDRLNAAKRLPEAEVAALGIALTNAIAALHAAGVVHRDIKPSNILLDATGAPVLADPGPVGGGTREWAAPEQLAPATGNCEGKSPVGAVGAAADYYALGLVLYRALTGALPPPRGVLPPAIEPPAGTLPRDIRPRPSHAWEGLLVALLRQDPATRLADAHALRRELRHLRQISRLWKGVKYTAPVAVVVAIVAAIVAAGLAARKDSRPPSPGPGIAAHEESCPPPLPETLSSRIKRNEKTNASAAPTVEQKPAATNRNATAGSELAWRRQVADNLKCQANAALFPLVPTNDGQIVVPAGKLLLWGDLETVRGNGLSIILDGGTLLFGPSLAILKEIVSRWEDAATSENIPKPKSPPPLKRKSVQVDFPIFVTDKGGRLDSIDEATPVGAHFLVAGPMRPAPGATNAVLHVFGLSNIILNRLTIDSDLKVTGCGQLVDLQPDGRRTNHRWFDDDNPL